MMAQLIGLTDRSLRQGYRSVLERTRAYDSTISEIEAPLLLRGKPAGTFLIHHPDNADGILISWVLESGDCMQGSLYMTLKGGLVEETKIGERFYSNLEFYLRSYPERFRLPFLVFKSRMRVSRKKPKNIKSLSWKLDMKNSGNFIVAPVEELLEVV